MGTYPRIGKHFRLMEIDGEIVEDVCDSETMEVLERRSPKIHYSKLGIAIGCTTITMAAFENIIQSYSEYLNGTTSGGDEHGSDSTT